MARNNTRTKIFVNLPVNDLKKSMKFFSSLGYGFNKQFTDKNAACLVISKDIYAMLLVKNFFKRFTKKNIVDARKNTEVMIALSMDNRKQVDAMVNKAIKAGGKESSDPEDMEFMYQRGFEDLDGHIWEIFWMDPKHIK